MTRALHLVNLLLVAALVGGSLLAWPELPAQVPTHFGITGRPDAWGERSPTNWFLLPAIATLVALLVLLSGRLLGRYPALLNIPDKDAYLALPAPGRAAVLEHVRAMLAATTTIMLAIFACIQLSIWRQAHGHATTLLLALVLVAAVTTTPLTLGVFLPRIQEEIERQRRH